MTSITRLLSFTLAMSIAVRRHRSRPAPVVKSGIKPAYRRVSQGVTIDR
jgi:hypothetical protein